MKIFSSEQIREIDRLTIERQGISSDKLMERAAYAFVDALDLDALRQEAISIVAGIGNNGGDALAISRILLDKGIQNQVVFCQITPNVSPDCALNLKRLEQYADAQITYLVEGQELPVCKGCIIDGLFGSGLNREVSGYWETLIQKINQEADRIIAIDIPSGFFADKITTSTHIQNAEVISFDSPKLSFMIPESQLAIHSFKVVNIGLDSKAKMDLESNYSFITQDLISTILSKRKKFSHKGIYGKVCIVGGTDTMVGGTILAGRAAMAAGAGYVYYQIPQNKWDIALNQHPEGIVLKKVWIASITGLPKIKQRDSFAYGIGPAMGQSDKAKKSLLAFLKEYDKPLVLDADALNIIAEKGIGKVWIPAHSVLTPHHVEFQRLFGDTENSYDQIDLAKSIAITHQIFICLKGAHTIVICPNGHCYFNSTGNPGMAVAGSGDVLTGVITSLIAQAKSPKEAAILGVYLHGYAGNLASGVKGEFGTTATDIIEYIPDAIKENVC